MANSQRNVRICPHLSTFHRGAPERAHQSLSPIPNGPGPASGSRLSMPRFPPIPAKSTPDTVERALIHHVKERHNQKHKNRTQAGNRLAGQGCQGRLKWDLKLGQGVRAPMPALPPKADGVDGCSGFARFFTQMRRRKRNRLLGIFPSRAPAFPTHRARIRRAFETHRRAWRSCARPGRCGATPWGLRTAGNPI